MLNKYNFIFIGLLSVLIFILIPNIASAAVCQSHDVSGWAWSANIGWISFSCENETTLGTGIDYGVDVKLSNGKFSGYAWSENIGWISFNKGDFGGNAPGIPHGKAVEIDFDNNEIFGWARALSACKDDLWNSVSEKCIGSGAGDRAGGWDGWIKFRKDPGDSGSNYGVYLDNTIIPNELKGWAWGSDVIGWISFNCLDGAEDGGSVCYKSDYKVFFNNFPPNKPDNTSYSWDNCSFKGQSIPTFEWDYSDPEGDPQTAFEIWVDRWVDRFVDYDAFPDNKKFNYLREVSDDFYVLDLFDDDDDDDTDWLDNLDWGTNYYWKVKVRDNHGKWSEWSDFQIFTTPSNAYPWVDFGLASDERPKIGVDIQFCSVNDGGDCDKDLSEAFGGKVITSWVWDFRDGTINASANPTHKYSVTGPYRVSLTIKDSSGKSCSKNKLFHIKGHFPMWREIVPFFK